MNPHENILKNPDKLEQITRRFSEAFNLNLTEIAIAIYHILNQNSNLSDVDLLDILAGMFDLSWEEIQEAFKDF